MLRELVLFNANSTSVEVRAALSACISVVNLALIKCY